MINNYFLLPSDIKVADKKKIGSNKVRLRYNNELNFSLVDLCVLDSKKKIKCHAIKFRNGWYEFDNKKDYYKFMNYKKRLV